jgi:hypothetical protein
MFSLTRFEWLALAAALLLCPGFSWGAGEDASLGDPLFDRLDRDKDGHLSAIELATPEARNSNWIAVDRDSDGRISRTEFNIVIARPSPQVEPTAAAGGTREPRKE